ncbi:hypothetical protein ACFQ0B_52070 [Nonomuraea thailandensis]
MTRTLFALKLRLFRNGPHNERGFSLVAGLVLAALVVAGAFLAGRGAIHEGWIVAAITVWGGMWLFGPLAQPRHDPSVISREWLRGYPIPSWRLARALSWTELLGVGPLITLACLSSLMVLAAPAARRPSRWPWPRCRRSCTCSSGRARRPRRWRAGCCRPGPG